MLAKIPEEILCGVLNSRPTFSNGLPQPPTVSPFGDETLQNAEIHLSITCLVEITNPCTKPSNTSNSVSFNKASTCKETVVTPRHVVVKHPGAESQRLGIEVRLTRAFVFREHQRLACCPLPPKLLGDSFENFDLTQSRSHNVPTFGEQRGCCRDAEDVVLTSWGSSRLRSPPSTLP